MPLRVATHVSAHLAQCPQDLGRWAKTLRALPMKVFQNPLTFVLDFGQFDSGQFHFGACARLCVCVVPEVLGDLGWYQDVRVGSGFMVCGWTRPSPNRPSLCRAPFPGPHQIVLQFGLVKPRRPPRQPQK